MSNRVETKKINLDRFEDEEEYDEIFFTVIPTIQNEIEESIRDGQWNKNITLEIEELKLYDVKTIDNIIDDINNYGGAHLQNKGFKVDMSFNGYTLTYNITVDTDVNCGHLDYKLMDKLLTNNYLHYIEDIENYIKAFGEDKKLIVDNDGQQIIVINHDPEEQAKVTFYVGDWGRWEHYVERIEE